MNVRAMLAAAPLIVLWAGCGGDFCGMEAGDLEGTFLLRASYQRTCTCNTGNCATDCEVPITKYGADCQSNKCTYTKEEDPITITIAADGAVTLAGADVDHGMTCEPLDTELCALKIRCAGPDGETFEFSLTER